jgi:hypothetical protein
MHLNLAPGEDLLPGTREAVGGLLARPGVDAVLMPLVPQGDGILQRAARRYLAAWDGRYLHAQNFFAPATRVATRAMLPGWRNADAAPTLQEALAKGHRVEALREPGLGIACGIADDLAAWGAHFAAEGAAWRALAARDARFRGFTPAPWWRHNAAQAPHRAVELLRATRRPDPLAWALHATRESAFTRT